MNATISDLLTAILFSEMSPVNKVLLTTELSRVLEETAADQSRISVEYEDNAEESDDATAEGEKTLTITITPVGLTAVATD
jgi:hypothetical protein